MSYEVHNSSIYGKILYKGGRPVIVNYDDAEKLLQRFSGTSVWKLPTGRYLIKLPETITSLDECDCEIVSQPQQQQPYAMGSNYSEEPRDNEVHMARADLYRTAKLAIMLHEMLKNVGEERGLDGWVQRKLTRAADYIESVFDYMDYEMRYPEEEMMEDPQVPGQLQPPQGQQMGTPQPTANNGTPGGKPNTPPGATKTPGMVKMGKIDTNGNVQGQAIMVPASQVKSKQQAGFHVIGESASAGASSAGGMAVGAMNGGAGSNNVGSLFGGTYNQKKKKRKVEASGETGPKFTGYWKGTDKGTPGKKMVGGN
jgi:hypothetical protein